MGRAQKGAEQLLAAAGLGEPAIGQVVQSIVEANDSEIARASASMPPLVPPRPRPFAAPPVSSEPEPAEPRADPEPEPNPEPESSI